MKYFIALILLLPAAANSQVLRQNGVNKLGVVDGSNAAVGFVGEFISTSPAVQGQDLPASTTLMAIATMTLTAGEWEISGALGMTTGATTAATDIYGAISTSNTSADTRLQNNVTNKSGVPSVSQSEVLKLGPRRVNITVSTTYYLIGGATYSVLGGAVYNTDSIMQARRIR